MCLIRDDLSTVWCEVTSSIRTRTAEEEDGEGTATTKSSGSNSDANQSKEGQLELLLCLRPIREGDKKVDESLRFVPQAKAHSSPTWNSFPEAFVSTSSGENNQDDKGDSDRMSADSQPTNPSAVLSQENAKRPAKKRALAVGMETLSTDHASPPRTTQKGTKRVDGSVQGDHGSDDTEKSVVESLMLMNQSSQ
jgi:hypothetical protein